MSEAFAGNQERKEGKAMIRRGIGLGSRLAAVALAMALMLSLAGDRGRAATVPAIINGQDPLEVLSLKIRPNIIIVLDSSGSMTRLADEGGLSNGDNPRSGDHPRSKMLQAKQVLRQVIATNETKASFQFGQYSQYGISMSYQSEGDNRFQYVADERDFPSMQTGVELTVRRALGDTGGNRGFQSWQIIDAQWNTLFFQEQKSGPDPICQAVVPGPYPRFFQRGQDLADEIENAMNSSPPCNTNSATNTYRVDYDEGTGDFDFSRTSGGRSWRLRWGDGPNNIRNSLAETSTSSTSYCSTCTRGTDAPWILLYRQTGYGDSNNDLDTQWTFEEEIPSGSSNAVEFFQLRAGRFWNGEVIRVEADGDICDLQFATPATKTNPPSVTVQLVANGCGADDPNNRVVFSFGGGRFSGNNRSCNGFRSKSALIPCDLQSPPAPSQIEMVGPYIDNELPLDANGDPADWDGDGTVDYIERMDGGWEVQSVNVSPSSKASGSTPIANSLIDIKGLADGSNSCITNPPPTPGTLDRVDVTGNVGACVQRGFAELWNNGQAGTTVMAGPGPWQLDAISGHLDPKEKTIVLFVTDGDDTCGVRGGNGSNSMDDRARRAAYWAERLYQPLDPTEPASSVQTYVIGFGGAWNTSGPYRLNWIAWGGSGLGQGNVGQPAITDNGDRWTEGTTSIANKRARCTTCEDAFIAPDAATLAATIQGIIDQGASDGEFSAQQSITESIFEYVELASNPPTDVFDPRDPTTRYSAIVPTRIISSFTLPGFRGQVKAYQNDGFGNAVLKWSAGDALFNLVSGGMNAECTASGTTGALTGECTFEQLHDNSTESTISGSAAAIKRRVYSTTRNGVYTFDAQDLEAYGRGAWTPPERVSLWPPNTQVAPTNYTSEGILDEALGLPLDTSTDPAGDFTTLQNEFGACVGNNLPGGCTSGTASIQMQAARREARDMMLAFMAGARPADDGSGGPKRASGAISGVAVGDILYTAKSWVLADSEFATAAVVTQPLPSEPLATPWVAEYQLFRDGDGAGRPNSDGMLRQGYGLRNPDGDASAGNDSRNDLKPVMTVVYSPANDMLHAFRAGPCYTPVSSPTNCSGSSTIENGGEELWGFIPFDQLNALRLRFINEPQGRDNHVYMLARGVRFSDVFVADDNPPMSVTVGGVTHSVNGVWRRILYIPRGIGGKYVTALDVTGPGAYTAAALDTAGPVPLWNRGNPDTDDGTATGTNNGTSSDRIAYSEMGETWSMPSIVYRDKTTNTNTLYDTARRPNGVDYVLYMGSGYGGTGEGSTFYTMDALSGDVIAAVDVETVAQSNGLDRTTLTYPNALVANAVGFNPAVFSLLETVHPAASAPTRVYIGDIHGRFWKFLTARPEVAIPVADLGEDQPIGTAASLLGMPPSPDVPVPFVYAAAGAESRADGPFKMFGFRDDGTDTQVTIGGGVVANQVTTFPPMVSLHTRTYDQGQPLANCGYTEEAVFRGTIQPATAFECSAITAGTCSDPVGRVFFGGTRLNLPNTVFAPPTPLACGTGDYPCRSSFDSIVYALGAKTGLAAYDLNASGDDAYRIFRDNRIAAIAMLADPDPGAGGSSFNTDEGEMKAPPKPPPPPGVPPTSTTATANVLMERVPGYPPPSVHYGSTVCQ